MIKIIGENGSILRKANPVMSANSKTPGISQSHEMLYHIIHLYTVMTESKYMKFAMCVSTSYPVMMTK